MTRDLPALRQKLLAHLPDFAKPRLAEFEAATRANVVNGYTIRWTGECWLARHSDNPTLSAGAMTPEAAVADLRMAIEAKPDTMENEGS